MAQGQAPLEECERLKSLFATIYGQPISDEQFGYLNSVRVMDAKNAHSAIRRFGAIDRQRLNTPLSVRFDANRP